MLSTVRVRRHARRLPSGARTFVSDHTRNRVLDVGRSAFTSTNLKIHRYSNSLRITDLANAGKRGKKVREMSVVASSYDDEKADRLLKNLAEMVLHMSYDDARASLLEVQAARQNFAVHESVLRGVDVEPAATKLHLSHDLPRGDRMEISASPHDFYVRHSQPHEGRLGVFYQDTTYGPAGTPAQQRTGARLFYDWLRAHPAEAGRATIELLRGVWTRLGVRWDSH